MSTESIDYWNLVSNALRGVVRDLIESIASHGSLPGDHHLFLTFSTTAAGVEIPESLEARFPDEMTIVLQHQYRDLDVDERGFSVTLSFSSVQQRLTVPFSSIIGIADPSANFALRFDRPVVAEESPEPPSGPGSSGKIVPFPSK